MASQLEKNTRPLDIGDLSNMNSDYNKVRRAKQTKQNSPVKIINKEDRDYAYYKSKSLQRIINEATKSKEVGTDEGSTVNRWEDNTVNVLTANEGSTPIKERSPSPGSPVLNN